MKRIEYKTMDRSEWGRGPWDNEPDKIQWQDDATGYPCLIVRNNLGSLCGYVGVPSGHPRYGKGYDDYGDTFAGIEVHGGLTYANACQGGEEDHSICHVPGEGESDDVWWLGFDCAHAYDLVPSMHGRYGRVAFSKEEVYRNVAYVTAECQSLAKQLREITNEKVKSDSAA